MGKDQKCGHTTVPRELKLYWKTVLCLQIKHLTDISSETQLRLYDELERVLRKFYTVGSKNPEQRLFTSLSLPPNYPVQDHFQCITIGPKEKP